MRTLVIIPTYNERENIEPIVNQLAALKIELTCLFVDDGSPDGTGPEVERLSVSHPWIRLIQRGAKRGIGGAHLDGLAWAKAEGFEIVVTMDCDLTHSPSDIPALLEASDRADVVVGSRYLRKGSLEGWNWRRKILTLTAHLLTRILLGIPYDCTGAFRVYRMDRIPQDVFGLVRSRSYPFFFESLFLLAVNGARIVELPISLPPRTYGSSKMPADEPFRGIRQLVDVAVDRLLQPERFRIPRNPVTPNPAMSKDAGGWDDYWARADQPQSKLYQTIATIYRRLVIAPRLTKYFHSVFQEGDLVLHAGCGSGQVDAANQKHARIIGLDASLKALEIYSRCVPLATATCHASVFAIPFPDHTFDGAYHLGVIEHFDRDEIRQFLRELRRVLKPQAKLLIFWPHERATSVAVIKAWHRIARKNAEPLHPPEISLAKGKSWVREVLAESGFEMESYDFGPADFWVQAVITACPADC